MVATRFNVVAVHIFFILNFSRSADILPLETIRKRFKEKRVVAKTLHYISSFKIHVKTVTYLSYRQEDTLDFMHVSRQGRHYTMNPAAHFH